MRVLVLDTLLNQAKDEQIISPYVLKSLYNEYEELAKREKEGYSSLIEYINKNDGKKFKGIDSKIFKFRLNGGDRILYTYGKHLPCLQREKDSLVLLGYSKHDDQEFCAKHFQFTKSHEFEYLKNIVEKLKNISYDNEELSENDLYAIASLIATDCFKGYAYTDEELCQFSPEEIEKHLLLSDEQKNVINRYTVNNSPTIIMGGAGTGKTLIAVHMLNDIASAGLGQSIAYFTQSKILLDKVKNQYEQLKSENNIDERQIVNFVDINNFCLDLIGKKRRNLVDTKVFIDEFMGKVLERTEKGKNLIKSIKKEGISDYNVWTEIRGTLKGGMQNWTRIAPMSQDNVNFNVEKYVKMGYINRLSDGKSKQFVLNESISKTIARKSADPELDNCDKINLDKIIKHFTTFDYSLKSIDDDYYLSLNDEVSLLTKEQRKLIIDIYHEYEDYLSRENRYDENDIVRMVIESGCHKSSSYDFVFVDEVQDYTELQIYLLYELAENKNNMIFAGDIHQIINPTLFNVSKLKELFLDETKSKQLKEEFLTTNFRCQKGVVDLANNLSFLRRKAIGSNSLESEQSEKSNVSICIYDPYRLDYNEDNVKAMMMEILKYPQVAVLVPDNQTRDDLLEIIKGYERPDFIFTVDEIKGMEYDYVVCYNLISYYQQFWNNIITTNIKKDRTKYRYFFNLLYVAITRARKLLCFIDEKTIKGLESCLKLKPEENFDSDLLHFSELDASLAGWINQAREYKNKGMYEIALKYYDIAKSEAEPNEIYDCHIGLAEEKLDYEKAVKYCILKYSLKNKKNNDLINRMKNDLSQIENNKSLSILVSLLSGSLNLFSNLASVIEEEFKDFPENERNSVSELFLEDLELKLLDSISKTRVPKFN